jgi:methylmalonyl-CoA mutase
MCSLYVMTPEFGAASQLEKIDMLDFADFVAINKFDRKGAEDALRDVRKQVQRNRELFGVPVDEMPVFGTMAARFNDDGVTALYQALLPKLNALGLKTAQGKLPKRPSSSPRAAAPSCRPSACATSPTSPTRCAATTGTLAEQATLARERQSLRTAKALFEGCGKERRPFR